MRRVRSETLTAADLKAAGVSREAAARRERMSRCAL